MSRFALHMYLLKTGIVSLMVCLCFATTAFGQYPATLEEDLKKVYVWLRPGGGSGLEMEQEYHWAVYQGNTTIPQSQVIVSQTDGRFFRIKDTNGEMMQNDTALIAVYHEAQTIIINNKGASAAQENPMIQSSPESLVAMCSAITAEDNGETRTYTFFFREGLCETMLLVFNKDTGMPLKAFLHSRPSAVNALGGSNQSETMEIRYLKIQPIVLDKSLFTLHHFVQTRDGKFQAAPAFRGYQVLNFHTTLKP